MNKYYVVSFDYNHFGTEDKALAMGLLEVKKLKTEYINKENFYIPIENTNPSLTVVDASFVRKMTKEEEENKALAFAENTASYYKNEAANLKKQVEELKCQIKVLTKEE